MGKLSILAAAAGALLSTVATVACAGPPTSNLEFADWVIPVADDVPVHEYPPVPLEERDPDAVRLVEDLVIGGDPSDEHTLFYQPIGLWASPAGDIFVAEMGNKRVQMFDADGNFVRTIGGEGQGPGEFQFPFFIIGDAGRFGVYDMRNRRISVFSARGDHELDQRASLSLYTNLVAPLPDGSFAAITSEGVDDRSQTLTLAIARFSFDGERLVTFAELPGPPFAPFSATEDPIARAQQTIDRRAHPIPLKAAGEGMVFISPASEYQVLAMSPDGELSWALRTAWPRPPYPERLKRSLLDSFRDDNPEIAEGALTWPQDRDALQSLYTDGHGRLYVFPNIEETGDEAPERYPVDVYSADGERLAAGWLGHRWNFARSDYVYGYGGDASLDQTTIVRYRLLVNGR